MSNELFGEVVKTISLDFAQKTSPVTVFAKQGDNRTRIIHIQPLMNGVPMNIDTSFQYVAKFAAKKPDGHYVYNDSAEINDDGTITVTLTDQTLAAHGNATCCIMLETQSDDVLTSQNFTLIIEYSAGAYKNLASSDEIMGLDDKLAQVQAMIDRLNREGQTLPPITAADTNKVLTANADGTAGWKRSGALYDGTVTVTSTGGVNALGSLGVALSLTQGAAYKVTFNGTDYNCVGSKEDIYPYLGNAHFLNDSREDTEEPFCLMFATHVTYLITNEEGSYTLAIYEATGGGLSVTEVSSPEEITADKPDGFYVVPGGEGGGNSGSGTKVIDLTDYNLSIDGNIYSFATVILSRVGSNGGRLSGIDDSTFWTDVNTDEPLKFELDASPMAAGMVIEIEANSVTKYNGNVVSVEATFVTYVVSFMRVTLFFDNVFDENKTAISVLIEPLDFNT